MHCFKTPWAKKIVGNIIQMEILMALGGWDERGSAMGRKGYERNWNSVCLGNQLPVELSIWSECL